MVIRETWGCLCLIAGEIEIQWGKANACGALCLVSHTAGGEGGKPGVPSAAPPSSLAKALHTQPFEVSSPDTADAVEAGVEVGGCLGKTRDAL